MARGKRKGSLRETLPGLSLVLRRFAPYLRVHAGMISGAMLALIAATLFKLLEPWPLKFIIDRVVPAGPDGQAGSGIGFVDGLSPMLLLALCAGALVVIAGLKAALQYVSTIGFALVGNRVLTEVRNDLFRHLQGLSMAFHSRTKTGDLTMRLISDVGRLKETAVTAALPLAANILILLGMIGVMAWLNWQLTLIALAPLPLLLLTTRSVGKKIHAVSRIQRKREGDIAATAAETMANMRSVQALSLEDKVADGFVGAARKSLKEGVKAKRLAAGLERSVDLLAAVALAAVLWFGTLAVLDGRMTPGDLLVFVTYLKNTFRPVRVYAKYTARLSKAAAAGERLIELFDITAEVADRPGAKPRPGLRGAVDFENLGFRYADSPDWTLRNVSASIEPGQLVLVTGPSGCGKSTLTSLLLRLYDPAEGRILIDGEDSRDMTLDSLRRQISYVPQEPLILRGTIRDNLALGADKGITDDQIVAAARLSNAHDFIMAQPQGYDTEIAERGGTLSAGQKQRIAIARAALREAPLLILDEPTVGLDGENETLVTDALLALAHARTTFLVSHDLSLAGRVDRILFLEGGHIQEDGTLAELLAAGDRFSLLWRLQQRQRGRTTDLPHVVPG